ncbi:phenoloxidase subunit 1-like [Copidosoma floridanum]|uniref:phenoloxidase subunit 1-like n=1 Tax=Copidosoma floridanum TaxID=29053 RepID=UPI000C6FB395|nr:phenoloxidase subunit 1-like [Copidosoma floridanum]
MELHPHPSTVLAPNVQLRRVVEQFDLLFDRPGEPMYTPKGEARIGIEVPSKFVPEGLRPAAAASAASASRTVRVREIALPDLSYPLSLPRTAVFSLFNPIHRKKANHLLAVFLALRTSEDLFDAAASIRDQVNPQMFAHALSIALLHRTDTKDIPLPNFPENFPDKFFDSAVTKQARDEANVKPVGLRIPLEIPRDWTASDKDPEHLVAYFREDVGINLHHWHWHLVYPFDGPRVVVDKDRRGELFYYMHHQIMARYDCERLCNNLPRVKPLDEFRKPIPEAYFPKLDVVNAGRAWPARPSNMTLSDVDRAVDLAKVTITDLENWHRSVMAAIRSKTVTNTKGEIIRLDDKKGIDIIGNMLEASPVLSPNLELYGDLHNQGHNVISLIHDPDHRYLENVSVMGDNTTAMRDPVFYRWHSYIDNLFRAFKDDTTPYSKDDLTFRGVTVTQLGISSGNSNPNTLNTHWSMGDINLSRGLDFAPRGAVLVRVTHLNHDEFSYNITVNNTNSATVWGTCRIFIAPRLNENKQPLNFNDQRFLAIEMDKFTVELKRGQNTITRKSTESSITIPYDAIFRDLNKDRPDESNQGAIAQYAYCGCGWPQYMLVPRGTTEGYPMDLFVMISDYQKDKVDQTPPEGCRTGPSFCGLRDRKYPDAQSMGFPFDRWAAANKMDDFRTPNMMTQQITVRYSDTVKPRK